MGFGGLSNAALHGKTFLHVVLMVISMRIRARI